MQPKGLPPGSLLGALGTAHLACGEAAEATRCLASCLVPDRERLIMFPCEESTLTQLAGALLASGESVRALGVVREAVGVAGHRGSLAGELAEPG